MKEDTTNTWIHKGLGWQSRLILLLLFMLSGMAFPGGITIFKTTGDSLSFQPGRVVTLFFNIVNESDSLFDLIPETELPSGWNLLIKDYQFTLESQVKESRLVTLYIPEDTQVGYYPVFYRVRGKKNSQIQGYTKLMIYVEPFYKVNLEFFQTPAVIREGEVVPIRFFVQNLSNVRDSVCLSAKCDEQGTFSLPIKGFYLDPKEVREATVLIKTDQEFVAKRSFCTSIFASSHMHKGEEAHLQACMDIIPKSNWKPDLYHRIPGEVTLTQVVTSNRGVPGVIQGEIRGGGPIFENGHQIISFHLKGPDQYRNSFLADHDQWTVQYQNPQFQAIFGDQTYKLSGLTENNRWGRGFALGFTGNNIHLNTYFFRTLWRSTNWKEWAGSLQYDFSQSALLKLNALSKNEGERYRQVYSINGQIKPYSGSLFASEIGLDSRLKHPAYDVLFSGLNGRFVYAYHYLMADNEFTGYYRNTQYKSYNLSVRLRNNFRMSTQFVSDKQNFELDTTKYAAPVSHNATSRLYYNPWGKTSLSLSYVYQRMEDRLNDASFNYRENRMEFEINQTISALTASFVSEIGETENYLVKKKGQAKNFLVGLNYTPARKHNYYVYVRNENNIRYFDTRYRRTQIGFRGQYKPNKQSLYSLSFRTNYSPEAYFFYRDILEARAQHRFSNGINLDLVVHRTLIQNSFDRKDNAGRIKIGMPFGIPVAKKKNLGIIKGKVTDTALIPMAKVQVSINGFSMLTNEQGEFIFPGLGSGIYWLHLDKNDRILNLMPSTQMPMKLLVSEGREVKVSLILVEKASLEGRVILCSQTSDSMRNRVSDTHLDDFYILESAPETMIRVDNDSLQATDCYGLKSIIIEMKLGDEVHRRISDKKGEFSFQELRPGKWTLKLYNNNLPQYYQFENEIYEMDLAQGEDRWIEVKALPKKRRIQFLQEGGTIQIQNQPNR